MISSSSGYGTSTFAACNDAVARRRYQESCAKTDSRLLWLLEVGTRTLKTLGEGQGHFVLVRARAGSMRSACRGPHWIWAMVGMTHPPVQHAKTRLLDKDSKVP